MGLYWESSGGSVLCGDFDLSISELGKGIKSFHLVVLKVVPLLPSNLI